MLVLLLILQGPTKGHQGSVHLCFHRSQNTSLIHALEQIWNVEGAVVCYILGITCAGGRTLVPLHLFPHWPGLAVTRDLPVWSWRHRVGDCLTLEAHASEARIPCRG